MLTHFPCGQPSLFQVLILNDTRKPQSFPPRILSTHATLDRQRSPRTEWEHLIRQEWVFMSSPVCFSLPGTLELQWYRREKFFFLNWVRRLELTNQTAARSAAVSEQWPRPIHTPVQSGKANQKIFTLSKHQPNCTNLKPQKIQAGQISRTPFTWLKKQQQLTKKSYLKTGKVSY